MTFTTRHHSGIRAAIVAVLALQGAGSHAQGNAVRPEAAPVSPAAARASVSPQVVEQKAAMVERVLGQPAVVQRVQGSGNDEARRHFGNARELYSHARALVITGQLRGADILLNEAIWEIGRAQQLAPDASTRRQEERTRFAQLQDSVDALMHTYQSVPHPAFGDRAMQRSQNTLEQARALAAADKHAEANRLLDQALGELLKDSAQRLNGQTLVYDRRFASAKEEFAFEAERQRSLDGLVPLALVEFRPSPEATSLIDRYVRQSRSLRDRADAQAAGGDHAAGLKLLAESVDALQRALQAAGLSVPQTMGSQ